MAAWRSAWSRNALARAPWRRQGRGTRSFATLAAVAAAAGGASAWAQPAREGRAKRSSSSSSALDEAAHEGGHHGKSELHKFVLTGGPCGGKTTAIVQVADRLRSLGFQVFVVPELATIFFNAGLALSGETPAAGFISWESARIRAQMALEDGFALVARQSGRPSVILCDRGTMDSRAYLSDEQWNALLNENSWNPVQLRDSRYDGVVHLVTAADGAVEFYTNANNRARLETPEEAIAADRRTRAAWLGHPRITIVGNKQSFDQKMHQVVQAFTSWLGLPSAHLRQRFLVEVAPGAESDEGFPLPHQDSVITSTFLSHPTLNIVLRRRGQDGGAFWYSLSIKPKAGDGAEASAEADAPAQVLRRRTIGAVAYQDLLRHADPKLRPVQRRRRAFVFGNQYMELDFDAAAADTSRSGPRRAVLIVESERGRPDPLPPFLRVLKPLDGDTLLRDMAQGKEL
jgi:thymidylate kinase